MIASPPKSGCIDVLVPRCLIGNGLDVLGTSTDKEGLSPIQVEWRDGKIISIKGLKDISKVPKEMLLPRFVEPHAHIDKAFSWSRSSNLKGSYQEALASNLSEYGLRSEDELLFSVETSLNLALTNGIRAIRSHIDSFGKNAMRDWEILEKVRTKWREKIFLQFVALVPLDFWQTYKGELLAQKIAFNGDLLGGVIAPPLNKRKTYQSLLHLVQLANRLKCDIDLHIDESQSCPAAGLKLLLEVLGQVKNEISITCSHLSSMGLLRKKAISCLAKEMAKNKLKVVALPLTNSWLLGREKRSTLTKRPLAPIFQLQKAGVVVSVGGDNVNDAWFPLSNFDPINLMAFSMPIAHLSPWDRLGLSPFTTSAAHILSLQWDGILEKGSPADFILLDSNSWVKTLSERSKRRVVVNGEFLNELPKNNNSKFSNSEL
ncbi:cytosine deaminase [Prochlorococcus marinus XMU1408]|uniref:Cytosine deaminase n=1 Tax=Prochlorococcus marinus XMU1408 TaxID=2213228 RepID=A0A318QZS1_PROMR|nr:amidohydrolase family protein [Prochlorococcus marinus]MBW3042484.1 cytosine deaminase [Prochlorococcus marinus str. XMU1408]PYE01444.1 cytosine deaminase [Prochlorococcus marinus XMU1408]